MCIYIYIYTPMYIHICIYIYIYIYINIGAARKSTFVQSARRESEQVGLRPEQILIVGAICFSDEELYIAVIAAIAINSY